MASDAWFRFYNAAPDHPKVVMLNDAQFRTWVILMSMASKLDGRIPDDMSLIGRTLRCSMAKARDLVQALLSASLLDRLDGGFTPHNWGTRQFRSDHSVSTGRVQRHRKRKRNAHETVSETVSGNTNETPPETETETETETEKKNIARETRAQFDAFWNVCPKKVGKGAAEKAFRRALKETSAPLLTAAMAKFAGAQVGKDPEFIAHPATWLNAKRWLDEDHTGANGGAVIHVLSDEVRQREQENLKKLGVI